MNTKVRQFVWAAVLTALLALNHTASAFYDTHVGRWISRDPIGERGGKNVNAFIANDCVNIVDFLGLYGQKKNKNNTQTITVGKCEVVFLIGHGNENPHTFEFPEGNSCSGGGYLGCDAHATNSKIPAESRIPGSPDWEGEIGDNDPDYQKAYKAMVAGLDSLAKSICDKANCGCKEVTISWAYAPAYEVLKDLSKPGLPKPRKYPCKR